MLTFRHKFVSANLIHIPSYGGINWYPSYGAYLTFHLVKFHSSGGNKK
jgi:hypothetical protein